MLWAVGLRASVAFWTLARAAPSTLPCALSMWPHHSQQKRARWQDRGCSLMKTNHRNDIPLLFLYLIGYKQVASLALTQEETNTQKYEYHAEIIERNLESTHHNKYF